MEIISKESCVQLLKEEWGITAHLKRLAGYEDQNYFVDNGREQYLLKVAEGRADQLIQMQVAAMTFLGYEVLVYEGEDFTARLLPWQAGEVWATYHPKTPTLYQGLGRKAAQHYVTLSNFESNGSHRPDFDWDLAQAGWIANDIQNLEPELRGIVAHFLQKYIGIQELYKTLPKAVIHNDLNDFNTLVANGKVSGFIDYGDMCYSQRINEVAILLAYGMMRCEAPLDAGVQILQGFTEEFELMSEEVDCLYTLIGMRLSVSIVSSQKGIIADPDNEYLVISRKPAIKVLQKLYDIREKLTTYRFKAACGMEITEKQAVFENWLKSNKVSQVCLLEKDDYYTLDLGVGSIELGHENYYNDAYRHHECIKSILRNTGKTFAIGSYDEVRPLYSSDDFTEIGNEGQRWRTVHIGLDFFQDAGMDVFAFAAGEVHALKYNEGDKNYGNTVILKHECFYTLYGHLSGKSLEHLEVGQKVNAGDLIAWFGEPSENGNWAPHLHFQIILDMLDYKDDFPGVCFMEERSLWTALCPDPRPQLGLEIPSKTTSDAGEILEKRRSSLGRSYSLSYKKPLHFVRANGAYLYDKTGRKYLDCVNNVPHVGHQNIKVVEAATKQMQLLNTNTRYLHQNIVDLAGKLTSTMPDKLKVCHFVNSGSEANELAIRMARIATGRQGVAAMEHGYHGNTSLCVDISSYKFNGKGGGGQKPFVQLVPMPDPVHRSIHDDFVLDQSNEIPAAFIHESILSCGGQVVLPAGFFKELYTNFRKQGMVMIADEVQTGLGRIGSHMWAFEAEEVQPDIVTVGKPFGNGHPLSAVVCTEEIADAFQNGMEYFNTFGGNPVSCAIGLSVLDEIDEQGLQEHALTLGQFVKEGLLDLKVTNAIIADVRGRGLFLGWEFAHPKTKEPLAEKASFFVNEMKRFGVLLSTDGPYHNVIKFKPPMVFSRANAEYMLNTMKEVMKGI